MKRMSVLLWGLGLVACGCASVDSYDIVPLTVPPLPVAVANDHIMLTEGAAVGVRIVLTDDGYLVNDQVEVLVEGDAAIVTRVSTTFDVYVLAGARAGDATLVFDPGFDAIRVPITVEVQPPLD
jgi:hypothetical protein